MLDYVPVNICLAQQPSEDDTDGGQPRAGGSELGYLPLLSFPSESSPLSAAHAWGRLTPLPADGMPSCEVILQKGTEPREEESLRCDCIHIHHRG